MRPPGRPGDGEALSGGRFRAGPLTSPASIVIRSPSDDADHASGDGPLLQLKVTLRDVSKPPVWRRVLVPDDCTLEDLHDIIRSRSAGTTPTCTFSGRGTRTTG